MGRKLGIDSQAVAYAVLEELLGESALDGIWLGGGTSQSICAHHLLEAAEVEFQPRARKLILTFDLAEPDVDVDEPVPFVPVDAGQSEVTNP